ncbi:MAG TPA: hypothetical protein VFH73_23080 [Polyangia bacterium]|nr:hypothetical protein [Polyangia bacterium]
MTEWKMRGESSAISPARMMQTPKSMRTAFLVFLPFVGLITGCEGSVDIYKTTVLAELTSGVERWSAEIWSTKTVYANEVIGVQGYSTTVSDMVNAIRDPGHHAPASMRWSLTRDTIAAGVDLPLPLGALQELPAGPGTLRSFSPSQAEIWLPIEATGFTFTNVGCPPDARVIENGTVVRTDLSKCNLPITGLVAGTVQVTSINPLAVQLDVTFTPTSTQPIVLRGPLTFTINESKTTQSD